MVSVVTIYNQIIGYSLPLYFLAATKCFYHNFPSNCLPFCSYNCREELVHPVEICIFYRSTFQIQGSETVLRGAPLHLYARIKEVRRY